MAEDKRIVKTRALLRATLQELMENHSFDDVTVKQICEKADVSRVTFYTHFNDKYALLSNLYSDFLNCVMQRCFDKCRKSGDKDDLKAYIINLFVSYAEEVYEDRLAFFRAIFKEKAYSYLSFIEFIARLSEDFVARLIATYSLTLSTRQLMSLLCYSPIDFLKATVFSDEIDAPTAIKTCREYYCATMDFVLKSLSSDNGTPQA